jgi:hypothetical protein
LYTRHVALKHIFGNTRNLLFESLGALYRSAFDPSIGVAKRRGISEESVSWELELISWRWLREQSNMTGTSHELVLQWFTSSQ